MTTEERINKLGDIFMSMNIADSEGKNTVFIEVNFKEEWFIDDETRSKFNVDYGTLDNGKTGSSLFFWCDLETGISTLLDAIEFNIEQNKIEEAKSRLFGEKMKELEDIFKNQENTLDDLKGITFELKKKKKVKRKNQIDTDQTAKNLGDKIAKSIKGIDLDHIYEDFQEKQKENGVETEIFSTKKLVPHTDETIWLEDEKDNTISLEDAMMFTDLQKSVEDKCDKAVDKAVSEVKERQEMDKLEGEIKGGVKIKAI